MLKSPWSVERAANFRLPFGKYAGRALGELMRTREGRSYLRWAAKNIKGNPGTAAAIAMGIVQPEEVAQ
jgi:uncharacterized protein (DUF3820 family)